MTSLSTNPLNFPEASTAESGFSVESLSTSDLSPLINELDDRALRVIQFGGSQLLESEFSRAYPLQIAPLGLASETEKLYEVTWAALPPVERIVTIEPGFEIVQCGELTFFRIEQSESEIDDVHNALLEQDPTYKPNTLSEAAFRAYAKLLRHWVTDELPQNFIRLWNYIPRILDREDHLADKEDNLHTERYRLFNIGRMEAWKALGPTTKEGQLNLPAATGIGSFDGPLVLEGLMTAYPVIYIENPRQRPAYLYSDRYGPRPPAFARATLHLPANAGPRLFVSGTASIVGEDTIHKGNHIEQIYETFKNLDSLIDPKNLARYGYDIRFDYSEIQGVRVYIRYPEDYPAIRAIVEEKIGSNIKVAYALDNICRNDLSAELECVFVKP